MYGLYGLKHHTVEISGDVTDAGRTTNDKRTREDSATQPLDDGRLSFAITVDRINGVSENSKSGCGSLVAHFDVK